MTKIIAVLSNNINRTKDWLVTDIIGARNVKMLNNQRLEIESKNGNLYKIIYKEEQGYGYHFNDYIASPGFTDNRLEDFIKTRIRK